MPALTSEVDVAPLGKIELDARPHRGQALVHNDPARFKVLACGRRWGKTRLGVTECLDVAIHGGRAWWVAPTYRMGEVGWRPLRQIGARMGMQVKYAERRVIAPGGGEVSIRSADNYDSLRGEGLDFVVMDECAFIAEEAWTEALRPTLSDRNRLGDAMFISTPKGHNWFWRYWVLGQDTSQSEWRSWRFPTSDNPFIKPSEIEAARQTMPERTFLQEYMAEFLDDAGGVFRKVRDAATIEGQIAPEADHQYVMGVDWGRTTDFTVLTVVDLQPPVTLVCMDRFNEVDYAMQLQRLLSLVEQYQPVSIIAEANSMGQPIIEQLQRQELPVLPFYTTSASKIVAIERLAFLFEQEQLRIPNDPVLIGELEAFEAHRRQSGLSDYSAPAGMHDDCVMSLALAIQGATASVIERAPSLWV